MNLYKLLFPKQYAKASFKLKPKSDHEIEVIFSHENIDYWKFVNEINIPIERAYAAMDIYAELEEKADKVYMETAFKAIMEYLKKGENINAGLIAHNALERMQHITNIDLLYKLASVLYFDSNESVYSYDATYNEKKIARWKKDRDIESFFLKTPLADYLPSLAGAEMNIQNYTHAQRLEAIKMLKFHLASFSESEKKTDMFIKAKLLIETLQDLVHLEE